VCVGGKRGWGVEGQGGWRVCVLGGKEGWVCVLGARGVRVCVGGKGVWVCVWGLCLGWVGGGGQVWGDVTFGEHSS
jgi:hypothetical protein